MTRPGTNTLLVTLVIISSYYVASTYIDQEPEGGKPGERDEEVKRPVHKGPREGDEPDEREEDGYARDDFGVDGAAVAPA
ncbi:hypothetical protein O1611_g10257 [Lasiodiplodia mahajangana]|uniref:Uncharacterized protein n=1 Tax=Lasiodiplodia mahajangana TaxID=1108764 RepID=A0ACC2J096_9PEZI|nr:hypothetical protein O1611_g10257 [Lasiodiplodia mahajangana]